MSGVALKENVMKFNYANNSKEFHWTDKMNLASHSLSCSLFCNSLDGFAFHFFLFLIKINLKKKLIMGTANSKVYFSRFENYIFFFISWFEIYEMC